jgi:hypothetical protein
VIFGDHHLVMQYLRQSLRVLIRFLGFLQDTWLDPIGTREKFLDSLLGFDV